MVDDQVVGPHGLMIKLWALMVDYQQVVGLIMVDYQVVGPHHG